MESWLYPTKDTYIDTTWKLNHHPRKPESKGATRVKNKKIKKSLYNASIHYKNLTGHSVLKAVREIGSVLSRITRWDCFGDAGV